VPKFASVIVDGGRDYRVEASRTFRERLATLGGIVSRLAGSQADLDTVLFPAGYFCTSQATRVPEVAGATMESLVQIAPPFAVVWGVDGWTDDSKREARCGRLGYPFFVFVRLPGKTGCLRFQQTAVSALEGLDDRWAGRDVVIAGTRNALLVCGETWSDRLLGGSPAPARSSCSFRPTGT
jgi:hypothetical protein